jgi:hypothetical protein
MRSLTIAENGLQQNKEKNAELERQLEERVRNIDQLKEKFKF